MTTRKIPKSIKPCPIKSASLELRFESNLKDELIRLTLYKVLKQKITNIGQVSSRSNSEPNAIEIRNRMNLICDSIAVGYSKNSLLFETVGDYPQWQDFYGFISDSLVELSSDLKIEKLTRLGIRYINFFDQANKLEEIVNFKYTLGHKEQKISNYFFKTEQIISNKKVIVTLTDNATFQRDDLIKKGSVLDIDVSSTSDLPSKFDHELLKMIEEVHSIENQVFFDILNEDYYSSLEKEF